MAPVAYQAGKGRWEGAAAIATGQGRDQGQWSWLGFGQLALWHYGHGAQSCHFTSLQRLRGEPWAELSSRQSSELREAKAETSMELLQLQPGVAAGDVLWDMVPVPGMGESQPQGQPW